MYRRKVVKVGPGSRFFTLPLPPEVAKALDATDGQVLDLDLVSTDDGETVLVVSKGD